jgi:membrane-associated protein
MPELTSYLDYILHLNRHLPELATAHGNQIYLSLFLVVFCETGLIVLPFLPGDSLLFAAGAVAASGAMDVSTLGLVLATAAIVGDAVNYLAGYFFGYKLHDRSFLRFINRKHIERTHSYFEHYGKMTIIIARFVPIVRTFAPFLAGVGSMRYVEFATFNIIGGLLWVGLLVGAGYGFGNIPWVKDNFSVVVLSIIAVSVLPLVIGYLRERSAPAAPARKS